MTSDSLIPIKFLVTRDELRQRGRKGAATTHTRHDPHTTMRRARAGLDARFAREADPDGTLSPDERARRVAALRHKHFTYLGQLSAAARRARKAMREGGRA